MSPQPVRHLTPAEYLDIERRSELKHEYFAGEMFAMTGASKEHNLIAGNVFASLHQQLKRRPCMAFQNDMRVKIDETGLYTYPDVAAVCGKAEFEDAAVDTLLNPTLLVEVLSDSTEGYDRGKKFEHYRKIPSFCEYLVIAQDRVHVEQHVRQDNGQWLLSEFHGADDVVELTSIGYKLSLTDVYDKVELPTDS
ncbi:MAG: Uma2 family endonuclease [Planctomycetes bacterium]|nr:Uma2 family endonuclease [Planctomycetota bacterium]